MAADRGIDAAGELRMVAADLFVECLAHAVQALAFEVCSLGRHGQHRGQGVCIMGGELRIESFRRGQQTPRTKQVVHIGSCFAGKHRVVGEPLLLAVLDLTVPIGTLDQSHLQLPPRPPGPGGEMIEQRQRALLIGLHGEAEAGPIPQARIRADGLQ